MSKRERKGRERLRRERGEGGREERGRGGRDKESKGTDTDTCFIVKATDPYTKGKLAKVVGYT